VRGKDFERHWLRKDDILISLRNKPLRASVIESDQTNLIAGSNLAVLRPDVNFEPVYFAGLLRSEYGQRLIESLFSKSSMTPLIKLSELKELAIPLPSLEVQRHLAALMLAAERAEQTDLERIQTRQTIIEATLIKTLGRTS
jgi:restriction endonuclease S subunit